MKARRVWLYPVAIGLLSAALMLVSIGLVLALHQIREDHDNIKRVDRHITRICQEFAKGEVEC